MCFSDISWRECQYSPFVMLFFIFGAQNRWSMCLQVCMFVSVYVYTSSHVPAIIYFFSTSFCKILYIIYACWIELSDGWMFSFLLACLHAVVIPVVNAVFFSLILLSEKITRRIVIMLFSVSKQYASTVGNYLCQELMYNVDVSLILHQVKCPLLYFYIS